MGKLICGKNSVLDALENELPLSKVYLLKPLDRKIGNDIKVQITSKRELDKLTKENHQGFIAELKEFNYFTLDDLLKDNPEKFLILDRVQDPHNFGAILRSANAFGIKHIVIAKDRQVEVTPTVLKVSSGGYVGVKIVRVDSMQTAIKKIKDANIWIYATAIEKGAPVDKVTFNTPMALVVGNEGKGVSRAILKQSDQNVFIPMKGTVQSLNVSVATGILLSNL
ncbi:23S rRNA (guanosine(2251)-2'-O)-methyltransferase RlmB [Mycoplasma todarodis]|uniref:23S rRNA (Guanosine(2251)-2'-O)-methyltransferase RlmB n=1 Tax=Mycoplasma todarodis TaxID=1937191 RepID=A0A4R0XQC0_9MOLU|nr:23S rRNA (guanosine(2251)-2'-O)-methyltransferase RlmB [Mycoplasma todarodis]TCG10530.1 23S rRNA (guanosine(2251)-2'-O)-methyltransferase RlmB [Mycoplasma todarodis]